MRYDYDVIVIGAGNGGLAAASKLGLRPLRQFAQRVKLDTTRTPPPISARERFILSFSSVKMRSPAILAESFSACIFVSSCSTPSSIRKPSLICPVIFPSTVTEHSVTLCITAFILSFLSKTFHFQLFNTYVLPIETMPFMPLRRLMTILRWLMLLTVMETSINAMPFLTSLELRECMNR